MNRSIESLKQMRLAAQETGLRNGPSRPLREGVLD
jgi:hypothetical protein